MNKRATVSPSLSRFARRMTAVLAALFLLLSAGAAAGQAEENAALLISEAQSNNDAEWALGFRDYVEVYNSGSAPVMLSDFFLTRDDEEPFSCHLPDTELAPGGYALLLCGTDLSGLSLSKEGCALYLYHRSGNLADEVILPAMEDNVWQREHGLTTQPSPGYANTEEGALSYRASLVQSLVINEAISANSRLLPVDDEYYDLIELANIGDEPVDTGSFYLSDKKKSPFMWQLPSVALQPGEFLVIQASGEEDGPGAPFKISSTGETLYLFDGSGECIDTLCVPALPPDASFGRSGNALACFDEPTIGKPNPDGYEGVTEPPQASIGSGLLTGAASVTLAGEGEIRYTLDGSDPDGSSALYDGTPIAVTENTVLRVRARAEGRLWSPVRTFHYLFDAAKYTLPLLCISSAPGAIHGPNGIYTRWDNKYFEAPANLTLIEDGQERFSVECGLKIHGQGSRQLKKKSFQVRFRGKYGCSELEYKLFEDSDVTTFNALVLRCGSEDANRAFLRDEFMTSLTAQAMPEVLRQNYRPVNLFIDGEYFGVYYIRERITDAFAASHLGGEQSDIDMINGWSGEEHGSREDWTELMNFCRRKDLSVQENFDHVASQISLESFMDYYIARAYTGDRDYANIRHVRSRGGDGLWRLVNFDLDWGFIDEPAGLHAMIGKTSDTSALNTVIINALAANEGFRDMMLTRLAWHLENTYAPARVLAHLDAMAEEIAADLVYNHERWGLDYATWEEEIERMRRFVRSGEDDRVSQMITSAKRAFRLTDEEMAHYFGHLTDAQ